MASTRPLYDGRYVAAAPPSTEHALHWEDVGLLIARLGMVALFLPAGLQKLTHFGAFAASLAGKTLWAGVALPYPEVFAVLAVVAELGGSVLLLFGLGARWAAILLVLFVAMATITTHRYWEFEPPARQSQQTNFYKNVAIAGGLFALAAAGGGAIGFDRRRRRIVPRAA
jgi:putative oxidoreductase